MTETTRPADALVHHWTERLPSWATPYARLSRWDRPVGWQLLLIPCWMGVALARMTGGFWLEDLIYALLFIPGAIAMRGAGCTINDILDRKIDAQVERTRNRPLPSGQVSVKNALIWLAIQCAIGLSVMLTLPLPLVAQIACIAALPFIAIYPLMKRITWWPQAWLGICFSWGAIVSGLTVDWHMTWASGLLFAGCIAWVIAYDTIYALQDVEDDALVGVRSTARLFGDKWRAWVTGFYVVALFLWGLAAASAGAGWMPIVALAAIGAFAIGPMLDKIDPQNSPSALAAFKANVWLGLAVVAAFALQPIFLTVRPWLSGN